MSLFTKTTCKKDYWVDENGVVLHTEGESKLPFTDWVYQAIYDGDTVNTLDYLSLYTECGCSSECYTGGGGGICPDLDVWMEEYEDEELYAMSQAADIVGVKKVKGKCTDSYDIVKIGLIAAIGLGGLYLMRNKL